MEELAGRQADMGLHILRFAKADDIFVEAQWGRNEKAISAAD